MREEFEGEFDPVQTALAEMFYWIQLADNVRKIPQKILVPLDSSIKGAEQVIGVAQDLLDPEGEGILFSYV